MALNVKKGDNVLVIAGKDKGKTGKVLVAMPADNSVVVAGVNIIAKHKKPRNANDKGGIIKREGKINASNVMIVCPVCGKATRISHKTVDGNKIRECKKCGANLDSATTKKATTKTTEKKVETKAAKTATKATETTTTTAEKKTATKSTATKSTATAKKTATTSKATAEKTTTTKKSTTKKVESK
ncbi:MAG: 50S ribosomal protein L24 [Clostridiales bacterium]|nr:50S ribosomal protein L24 [Clostridiales bacterium]